MPSKPHNRYRRTHARKDPRVARKQVHRWMKWFIPPALLLIALGSMHVDKSLIAICLLAFPVIIIRTVEAWGDYQAAREESLA